MEMKQTLDQAITKSGLSAMQSSSAPKCCAHGAMSAMWAATAAFYYRARWQLWAVREGRAGDAS